METISEIYKYLYENEESKNPNIFIARIEPFIDVLLITDFNNYDDRYKATRLISDYAIDLFSTGFTRKSIIYLNKAVSLFESDEKIINKDLYDEPMYQAIIWTRGQAYYSNKKFTLAKQDFKKLYDKWQDNDLYIKWYNASFQHSLDKIQWGFMLLLFSSILFKAITGIKSHLISYIGITCGVCYFVTFIYYWIKKIK